MEPALASHDPAVSFEPIAWSRGLKEEVPVESYSITFGRAAVRREGTDVTVVTCGPPMQQAMAAAEQLAADGISVEVIDLRTLYPWDVDTVLASVEKTGRIVTAHEDHLSGGIGAEIVATIAEQGAYFLASPPGRIGPMAVFWGPTQPESVSMRATGHPRGKPLPMPGLCRQPAVGKTALLCPLILRRYVRRPGRAVLRGWRRGLIPQEVEESFRRQLAKPPYFAP